MQATVKGLSARVQSNADDADSLDSPMARADSDLSSFSEDLERKTGYIEPPASRQAQASPLARAVLLRKTAGSWSAGVNARRDTVVQRDAEAQTDSPWDTCGSDTPATTGGHTAATPVTPADAIASAVQVALAQQLLPQLATMQSELAALRAELEAPRARSSHNHGHTTQDGEGDDDRSRLIAENRELRRQVCVLSRHARQEPALREAAPAVAVAVQPPRTYAVASSPSPLARGSVYAPHTPPAPFLSMRTMRANHSLSNSTMVSTESSSQHVSPKPE